MWAFALWNNLYPQLRAHYSLGQTAELDIKKLMKEQNRGVKGGLRGCDIQGCGEVFLLRSRLSSPCQEQAWEAVVLSIDVKAQTLHLYFLDSNSDSH